MGDAGVLLLIVVALIVFIGSILGWVNYKIDKMKDENKLSIETIASIIALEKAMKKLNEALRTESRSLSNYKQRLRCLERRIDILESGHPDSEFDYATTDDDGNALEVWFNGKKYVPEDKLDEDAMTVYADGRIVAETTRPDVRCCATCQYYRPGEGHTCALCYWLNVTKTSAATPESACHNYEKAYAATKGEVDHLYTQYKNMGGNGRAEELSKSIVKLNYLASDAECDELLKRVERLNRIYDAGLMSLSEYGERLKELKQNDS